MLADTLTVEHLYRYPIKSLSGEELERAEIATGGTMPRDRRYGIAHASSQVDAQNPAWRNKRHFLHLARDEKLGELAAVYTADAQQVALLRQGRQIVSGDLSTSNGRMVIEDFLSSFMPSGARGHARIVDAGGAGHFSDWQANYLSLINLATLKDIERVLRAPVDMRRFRGNVYITGASPWQEHAWVGKRLRIGGLLVAVESRIERCNAVNVDPDTGRVEQNIPLALRRGFRSADCGVLLSVLEGGIIKSGDGLEVMDDG
ncbi:MAG: MOSC domain-containing protein [Alphaproteobacteria bacterium]|nr:MOSC domain-containing protein [Alphaproteobacteria bacterium]